MPLRSRAEAENVEIELIRSVYDAFVPSVIMSIGFALCALLITIDMRDPILPWVLGGGIIASVVRLTEAWRASRRIADPDLTIATARSLERRFAVTYYAFALMLGLFTARCFIMPVIEAQMLATCLTVGYGAGVAAGIGLRPRIAVPSMLVAIVPGIVAGLWHADPLHAGNALLMAALLAGGIGSLRGRHDRAVKDIGRRLVFSRLARRDVLTALPNRLALREWYEEQASGIVAVHYLDLNGFKPVNDTYGHPAGDALLSAVGKRIAGLIRDGDIVARLGGDEFAVIQREINQAHDAEFLAQRLRIAIARPFGIGDHHISVSVSIGYVLSTDRHEDLDQLLRLADEALYRGKRSRRGVVCSDRSAMHS